MVNLTLRSHRQRPAEPERHDLIHFNCDTRDIQQQKTLATGTV